MLVMIDLDNTLADRCSAVSAVAHEFCSQHDLPAGSYQWILEHDQDGYADRRGVFEAIRSRFALSAPIDSLLAAYRSQVVALTTLTPGAMSCLNALRSEGHVVVIVTNGSSQQQHAKIDALDLRSAVDGIVVSEDIGIKKPDRGIFETAATATGTTLTDAWMVGDSPRHDIVGAARLGVRTAWLHRGRSWSEPEARPTATLDSLMDLPSAISGTGPRTN